MKVRTRLPILCKISIKVIVVLNRYIAIQITFVHVNGQNRSLGISNGYNYCERVQQAAVLSV